MKSFLHPLLCLMIFGLILASVTAAQAESKKSEPKAEIVSLKITKGQAPFNETEKYDPQKNSSTEIRILVTSPEKKILDFNELKSQAIQLDDDQGTNLLEERSRYKTARFWPFTNYYDHKQQCIVTLSAPNMPSAKAAKLHLKANLVFRFGSDKTTTEEAKITPTEGGSFTLNKAKVIVSDKAVNAFGMSDREFEKKGRVQLRSSKSFDDIASITFLDSEGKKVKYRKSNVGISNFLGQKEYTVGYILDKKEKTYTVKIAYYTDATTVTIPIDQKIGVGL